METLQGKSSRRAASHHSAERGAKVRALVHITVGKTVKVVLGLFVFLPLSDLLSHSKQAN